MHNTHAHFYGAMERSQASYDFISRSLITQHSRDRGGRHDWCPPLQMRDVQTQTFSLPPEISYTSTGVCRLQRTGIPSYHRRRQQQMHSRMCRRACGHVHVVHGYGCVRKHTHVCAAMCWCVCVRERICMHPQKCSRKRTARSAPFPITLPGERRKGRGQELAVTPVPRTSSGPIRQLKLDVCALSASSNSYKGLQLSESC